jgi:hypothetical protein
MSGPAKGRRQKRLASKRRTNEQGNRKLGCRIPAGDGDQPEGRGLPYLAETLRLAGVTRNLWCLPACQSLYLTELGPVVTIGAALASGTVDIPPFDRDALVAALRTDQAGNSTFPEFLDASWRAGVVRTMSTSPREPSHSTAAMVKSMSRLILRPISNPRREREGAGHSVPYLLRQVRSVHPEAERIDEQSDGSEENTWRRAIQNTKGEAAQDRDAEVCKRLAIGAFRKFSFPRGPRKPRADVLRKRTTPLG